MEHTNRKQHLFTQTHTYICIYITYMQIVITALKEKKTLYARMIFKILNRVHSISTYPSKSQCNLNEDYL